MKADSCSSGRAPDEKDFRAGRALSEAALLGGPTLEDAYAEGRRDEQQELSSVLPGVTYMDPPDGGAPTILEQLQRQAKDAARYLWLRVQHDPADLPIAQVVWKRGGEPRGEWVNLIDGNDLDRHIDAAMKGQQSTSAPSALLPCPFCAGEAEIINTSVHCNNPLCEAQPFTAGQTTAEAVAAWNRRPSGARAEGVE